MSSLTPHSTQSSVVKGMGIFNLIFLGQVLSQIGSGLSNFAIDVWVYQRTQSVTQFAVLTIALTLPAVIIAPLAGTLVDRWSRRWIMIISSFCGGVSILSIGLLFHLGRLAIWQIYLAVMLNGLFLTFHWLAFTASITLLVPPEQLGRASGMTQMIRASSALLSPLLGSVLLGLLQLQGIVLLDFGTLTFALVPLLLIQIPELDTASTTVKTGVRSLIEAFLVAWAYLKTRPGLLGILSLRAIYNLAIGGVVILFTPFLLTMTTSQGLGIILSIAATGMVLGGAVMAIWGNKMRSLIYLALGCIFASGTIGIGANIRPSLVWVTIAAFCTALGLPLINGVTQILLQRKIPAHIQGRVFSLDGVLLSIVPCLAAIIMGPLADSVFEPRLAIDGAWAGGLGMLIGTGPGRGIAFLFILIGGLAIVTAIVGLSFTPLRSVEHTLPDQNN